MAISHEEYKNRYGKQINSYAQTWAKNNELKSQQENKKKNKWFQSGAFADGYQVGDVTKTIFGTGADLALNAVKGVANIGDSVSKLIAGGTAEVADVFGADKFANKVRNNIKTKENFVVKTITNADNSVNKNSVSGEYVDKVAELMGYTAGLATGSNALTGLTGTATIGGTTGATLSGGNIGLTVSGHTLNIPTLALIGGTTSGYEEALSKEDTSMAQRWAKSISSGLIEGTTEGIFGMFGIGGNELTDALGEKLASKFSTSAGKILAKLGMSATGESAEEFLSYAGNWLVDNNIIDKLGNADFKSKWDWGEVGEQMALAFASSALSQGGASVLSTNSAIKSAEEQLGRKLNNQEKVQVTQAVIEGTVEEKINKIKNNQKESTNFNNAQYSNDNKKIVNIPGLQLSNNINNFSTNNNITNNLQNQNNNNNNVSQDNNIFSQQVDEVLNGTYPKGNMLVVSENTPKILQDIGLKNFPITITQRHLKTVTNPSGNYQGANYHNLGVDLVKQLPDAIANPLNILKSDTKSDSIVVITELADNQDRPIIASIKIDGKGIINDIEIDSNVMTSAYGRNNYDKFMRDNIAKGNLLYDIDEGIIKRSDGKLQLRPITSSTNNNSTTNQQSQIAPLPINSNMQQNQNNTQQKIPTSKDINKINMPSIEPKQINNSSKNSLQSNLIKNDENVLSTKPRKWVKTSTESESVKGKVLIEDLDPVKTNYVVRSNKSTLEGANTKLNTLGYDNSLSYIKSKMNDKSVSLEDIALAERLIQESAKKGDTKTASDLIMDVAILGTELGQKVQALSIIQRLTPEGQLAMYEKIVNRAKIKGEKAYADVNITQEMTDTILGAYNEDGTYDQNDLNRRVEEFKQQVAEQLKSSKSEKINEWRYLSMLGNPKTHLRNMISNIAMTGTIKVKNVMARTSETFVSRFADIERTKTWKKSSNVVNEYAQKTSLEMKKVISGESKYGEKASIESKKQVFKNKTLEKISNFNSNALEAEDWFFSRNAFKKTLSEYLTANGIETQQDIDNNPKLIEKAKLYAVEQAEIATFRQYSKLASLINKFERNNKVAGLAIGATIPFKKTPINVAKAGVNYSPIGLIKSITYDAFQLHKGNINASQFIDNISQGLTGTALSLLGYAFAKAGFVNGVGDDDKEGKMDYYLGNQSYSLKIGNTTFPISWVSPVAMPFLVGANAYEKLENQEEWDANIVIDTLAQTLDPLSEMSFISSLTDVLQSYDQGSAKMISSMGEKAIQSYIGQFFPTLFSQVAATFDDTKRSTSASKNSPFKFGEETVRQIMYKIPGIRNMLEPSTNIWGEAQKQSDNILERAFNNFLNPSSPKEYLPTKLEEELKRVYRETGDTTVIPGIPYGYINYRDTNYQMSASEYTKYKNTYGQNAKNKLNQLIQTSEYKNAPDEQKSKMIEQIYKYSKAIANEEYFNSININYTSTDLKNLNELKELGMTDKKIADYTAKYAIMSSIKQDTTLSSNERHQKISDNLLDSNFNDKEIAYIYEKIGYSSKEKLNSLIDMKIPIKEYIKLDSTDIEGKYNVNTGKTISGSKKEAYIQYVNNLKLSIPQRAILIKMQYNTYNSYNSQITNYVSNLNMSLSEKKVLMTRIGFDNYKKDVFNYVNSKYKTASEKEIVLKDLGYTIKDGKVYW